MARAVVCALVGAGMWLLSASVGLAQALPLGPDFHIGGDPDLSAWASAAIDSDRWFVVAYWTYFSNWPEACGFSDSGVPLGCQVLDGNGVSSWSQRPVDVTAIDVDDFLVVWETTYWVGGPELTDIRGRRMSAHAVLLSEPFVVRSSEVDHPRDPRVAALPSSRVVIVWVDDSSDGTDGSGSSIQARVFTTDGTPVGPPFQVNTTVFGDQTMPDVAAAPDGRFVVTWQSESSSGSDASGTSVQIRRFDADGLPIGNDQQVNTFTDSDQRNPRATCAGDGSFVVVWDSDGSSGSDGSSLSIQTRIFGSDGSPLGPDLQVNSYVENEQSHAAVGAMDDGGFEVVWSSDGSPGDDDSYFSIQRQAFDADGGPAGSQVQVNTTTYLSQWAPDIAMTAEGDLVAAWDDTLGGVRGRIYRQTLLADGFESGDTSAWSAAVP